MAVSAGLLAQGYGVRFRASGGSMHPALCHGDVITIAPAAGRSLTAGSVILYRDANRVIAHRVVHVAAGGPHEARLLLRGDAMPACDAPISRAQVMGELVGVRRAGAQPAPARVAALARRVMRRTLGALTFGTAEVADTIVR